MAPWAPGQFFGVGPSGQEFVQSFSSHTSALLEIQPIRSEVKPLRVRRGVAHVKN
jgi:hypothetical protein